jgi:hypothetical protein
VSHPVLVGGLAAVLLQVGDLLRQPGVVGMQVGVDRGLEQLLGRVAGGAFDGRRDVDPAAVHFRQGDHIGQVVGQHPVAGLGFLQLGQGVVEGLAGAQHPLHPVGGEQQAERQDARGRRDPQA